MPSFGMTAQANARLRLVVRTACLALAMCGFSVASPVTGTADVAALRKGAFLLATSQLSGSLFSHAVIFITGYGSDGATGLIINRPMNIALHRAIPELGAYTTEQEPLFFGGPVVPRAVFALFRTPREHASEQAIVDNIAFAAGKEALIHMLDNAGPDDAVRAYAGYAGWAPGQLEHEIARGDWQVIDIDPAVIFDDEPNRLWADLTRQWSGQWI